MTDTDWYVATADGLFQVMRNNGAWECLPLGLHGMGGFRAPVVVDCTEPGRVYAGTTRGGMFRSDDQGATWCEINNGIIHKSVWSLAQRSTDGLLFAGTSPAGVFRSCNGGESWSACDGLWALPSTRSWSGPIPPHTSRLKDLAISREDPALVFGAIEEGWVVRSPDAGEHWEQIENGVEHDSHTVRFVPGAAATVVVGGSGGMRRSVDGGNSWSMANDGLGAHLYTPGNLVTREERPGVLFTSVAARGPANWSKQDGGVCAFCKSDDGGATWSLSEGRFPQPLAPVARALAADPSHAAGYVAGFTDGTLWATRDDGESFEPLIGGLPAIMGLTAIRK